MQNVLNQLTATLQSGLPTGALFRVPHATLVCAGIFLAAALLSLVAMLLMHRRLARVAAIAEERGEELQRILDALPAMVFYKDTENNLVWVNRLFARAMGRPRKDLEGRNCAEIFPAEADAYWEDDRQVLASGESKRNIVERMVTAEGPIWVRTDKIPIPSEDGHPRGLIGFSVDITAQREARMGLEEQLSKNDALIRAVGEVVYERDLESAHIEWSGAVKQTLGLDVSQAGTLESEWMERIHADDQARVTAQLNAVAADKTRFNMEYRFRHKDGHYVWISDRGIARQHPVTGRRTLIGIMEDIGYRKHYEEMITDYTAKLERSNKDLQQFAYVASHDLQEPLRKIIAFGDLLTSKDAGNLTDNMRMCVDRMQSSALRMRTFIEDLLQYSRVTTRKRPAERVDLNAIAEEVRATLELQIAESGGILDIDDLDPVHADPAQVRQLIQNLVSNALKYRSDQRTCVISLRSRALDGDLTEFTVSDNGIGFDPQFSERVFAPFQRLHSRSEYEGTGMGLAICRRIAEAHGGTIEARGTPGEGAAFVITLPSAPHEV